METHIAILRGINVSGQKMIKMEELKSSLKALAFVNLTTYIQSGNLIFEHEEANTNHLAKLIEEQILIDFRFHVPVIVKSAHQLRQIFSNNPFINIRKENIEKLHVTFLSDIPSKEYQSQIEGQNFIPDEFFITNDAVYVFCPNGYGITKINNNFFEKKLKVSATTRNWKTVIQLVELTLHR